MIIAALAIACFGKSKTKRYLRFGIVPALFVLLVVSIIYEVSDYFTDAGINEAVIFHFKYGLEGAGFAEYSKLIGLSVASIVLALIICGFVFYYLSVPQSRSRFNPVYWTCSGVLALIAAFVINPATSDLYHITQQPAVADYPDANTGYAFDENFRYPEAIGLPDEPINIVYIYLESFEDTYFNEKLFPGLVPELKSIKNQSVAFSHILQVTNTGWTIAGITASQCGIPLVTSGLGNSMSKMDRFLPGAVCIGDLLEDVGYSLNYMGGASLEFAGKGKFYHTHGFTDVRGLEELRHNLGESDPVSEWGLYDPDLLHMTTDRFFELSKSGKPFGLFMLTLDTHHPKGHIPTQCEGMGYGDGSNPMLNAVHCSDKIVSSFINAIRASEFSDNTLIAVGSDHLAFRNLAYDQLSKAKRRNLFFLNLPDKLKPRTVNKIGSVFDLGPTVMKQLGFDVEALGLGRDLLGSEQTIVEIKRGEIYNYLKSLNNDLMTLWDFPQLDEGLRIIPGSAPFIEFGSRTIKFPALILVNNDFEVEQITFGDYSPRGLIDHVQDMDSNQLFIWIDLCRSVSNILPDSPHLLDRAICVAAGTLDGEQFDNEMIETKQPLDLSRDEIMQKLSRSQDKNKNIPDMARYNARIERLENFQFR